jgi:hypothetical protein
MGLRNPERGSAVLQHTGARGDRACGPQACCEAEQASLPAAAQGFRFERTFSKWHSLWRCPMLLNPRHRVRA